IVALDADHEAAGKLIVATGLGAADEAMLIVLAERLAEKIATGRAHDPVLLRGPQAARMAAQEAARPAPRRDDRRRRLIKWNAHVGRDRCARQRNQRGRCNQEFPHHLAPAMKRGRSMQRVGVEHCSRSATPAWICAMAPAVVGNAPTCVTRGRDPRGHHSSPRLFAKRVGCRVKPGNDEALYNAELGQNPSWDSTIMTPRWRLTFFA